MWKFWSITLMMIAVILAGCAQDDLPPGILEFAVPAGKFRVETPDEWVETPELGGYNAVESADLDLVFGVLAVDPDDAAMAAYENPREYEANGRHITVYDGLPGDGSTFHYFGIEHYPEDVFHAVVSIGDHRYHTVLVRSTTVALHDGQEQIFVDLMASLEPLP